MKFLILEVASVAMSAAALLVSPSAVANNSLKAPMSSVMPHYDLEMTGQEYRQVFENPSAQIKISSLSLANLQDILQVGKRNLDWLKLINASRKDKLSLSTEATQQGYPMDQPREYNPTLIRASFNNLKTAMPTALSAVIFGTGALPTTLPVTDEEYIEWGLKTDRVYQIAARWLTMEPYLGQLRMRQFEDIRGFYFLSQMKDRKDKFSDFKSLPAAEQEQMRVWLVQMCMNARQARATCKTKVEGMISGAKTAAELEKFFADYSPYGQSLWDELMLIPSNGKFPDVRWNGDTDVRIPFRPVTDPAIANYLTKNLQEEWQFGKAFNLYVDFSLSSSDAVFVTWQPGVTPHVPYLGASEMVMDSNAPISEYDVQWTIRHEFGHVLGLPDCYVEFYNEDTQSIISYQLDTTDLMCSRRGHINQRHLDELRANYSTK
ncbi:MAG: hypothetical protein AABZ31_01135, partial [Bdellovibrionota bacterium]